ncbi:septum formation initiator family protein [Nocardioides jiangxiensis]|uniref:Septum formation initiator family protein n=1 Tax=Nocardioides jiangxiensis TaxID=3064524 RepID=A0ABT9B4L9_9ACTN|nr:septum formation initiator family protein [Nocardioides sp. WY-20]MDO7869340.1 septum formation initiator family protein [Nocardioides sp. WY-20]
MSTPQLSRVRVTRIAEEAVERARLRVVPRTRVRAPKVPFVMLVSAILLAGVVGLLLFNTTMQQNSFAESDLQAHADELRSEQQALQAEIDSLNDPQRIGEEANRLGMVMPVCPRFLDTATNKVTQACDEPATKLPIDAPAQARPESLIPERTVVKVKAKPTTKQTDTPQGGAAKAVGVGSHGVSSTN